MYVHFSKPILIIFSVLGVGAVATTPIVASVTPYSISVTKDTAPRLIIRDPKSPLKLIKTDKGGRYLTYNGKKI